MDDGLLIGGKYRLSKLIGSGGMGQVWIGRNEVTERQFALKLLLPQAATSREVVTRFVQEAKVSGRLRHPGILEIYDVGTAPELHGAPFLVMELLHGVSLDAAIKSLSGLPLRFTLLVAIAIARALGAAHDKGVVHRDLKPANVFLHRDDSGTLVPKLLDFGISKLNPIEAGSDDAMGLTQTGALLGSPRFMSPEQIATQRDIDGRSDLHALGVLVWWCLLARSPFDVEGFHNLMLEILSDRRPRLLDVMPDVPVGVSDFVSRAFARKREDRYANGAEALAALEAELAKLGSGPTLETKAWVDEVLSAVVPPPPPVAVLPRLAPPRDTTTHGAVSVSLERASDPSGPRQSTSPAAATMGELSPGPALAITARERRGSATVLALGLASLLVAVALVVGFVGYGWTQHAARAAAGGGPPVREAAAALVTIAAPGTAEPTSLPPAQPSSSLAALPVASAPRPLPALRASGRAAMPRAAAVASALGSDPFHGVTGTGL